MGLSLAFEMRHQQVYSGLPSTIHYDHPGIYAPDFAFMKTYSQSRIPSYYVVYSLPNRTRINITSSPIHCPHVSSLLSEKGKFPTDNVVLL